MHQNSTVFTPPTSQGFIEPLKSGGLLRNNKDESGFGFSNEDYGSSKSKELQGTLEESE